MDSHAINSLEHCCLHAVLALRQDIFPRHSSHTGSIARRFHSGCECRALHAHTRDLILTIDRSFFICLTFTHTLNSPFDSATFGLE